MITNETYSLSDLNYHALSDIFTAVTWAEEKASAASDKILSQQQVDELLQADDNPAAYVKIDEDAYKVYPDFKDKKAVRKELLKNLPTNKVLYLLTASEQTFTLAFDVVKDLENQAVFMITAVIWVVKMILMPALKT